MISHVRLHYLVISLDATLVLKDTASTVMLQNTIIFQGFVANSRLDNSLVGCSNLY